MENQTFETIDLTQPEEPKTAPAPKAKRAPAKRKAPVESKPLLSPTGEQTSQPSEPIITPTPENPREARESAPSEPAEQTEPLISPEGDNESPPEVEPPTPKPKAKAKSRARSKPPPPTPEVVDVETTTRKPKGHRPKMENKPDLKEKMPCEHCGKMVSRHNLKYTHKCSAKPAPVLEQPTTIMEQLAVPPPLPLTRSSTIAPMTFIAPLTVREKMQQDRVSVANRLIAQAFS